jgi:UDP-3-O-[3-hydroxymyristoyl] glucosamine N-acyltransferase
MKKSLQEIAEGIGGRLVGDGTILVDGVTNLDTAAADQITFADEKHFEEAAKCRAAAVILPEGGPSLTCPVIYTADPRAAFAKLLAFFTPKLEFPRGISSEAHIGKDVQMGKDVVIMPLAVVDDHAKIGDHVTLYPHTYIGQHAQVGDDTVIYANVVVREYCKVGKRCIIQPAAVIGSDGFGFTTKDGVHTKVPQVGNVILEDDVEIGANDGIDRATTGSTLIGHGTKVDNLVHIGHNCKIGPNCLIVAQTGISGSTVVGHNVTFGGQVGTVGHIEIGANSLYAARSGIIGNMPEGYFGAGFPVQPHQDWLRMQAAMKHFAEMRKQIKSLAKKLSELQK